MKPKTLAIGCLALLTACPLLGQAPASLRANPAYVDVDSMLNVATTKPEVNINLPKFLLRGATKEMAAQNEDLAAVVASIDHIRLMVIPVTEDNRATLDESAAALRAELDNNWMPIVSIPDEGVGIYAMSNESGDEMAGMSLLIKQPDQVVFINIVGNVPLDKVMGAAQAMGGEDMQKIIQGFIPAPPPPPPPPPPPAAAEGTNHVKTETPAPEAPKAAEAPKASETPRAPAAGK